MVQEAEVVEDPCYIRQINVRVPYRGRDAIPVFRAREKSFL
jgi:hypothetical protein